MILNLECGFYVSLQTPAPLTFVQFPAKKP